MYDAPVGVMLTDWKVNVRVAIRAFENLPVPWRLVITPCGEVALFDSEDSRPSSIPACRGYRSTWRDSTQSPAGSVGRRRRTSPGLERPP